MRSYLKAALVVTFAAALATAAPAGAEETCQAVDADTSVCVATTGDPTTGSFGVRGSAGPLNVCVVVFSACP